MINNLVLRRLRYALNLTESDMKQLFALAEHDIDEQTIRHLLLGDDHSEWLESSDEVLAAFLDGLVISRRGLREDQSPSSGRPPAERLTNNLIMKKIRIALELREEYSLEIMEAADFPISKSELGALLRKPGSRQYKPCGDQLLRNFLMGLCKLMRPEVEG